MSDYTTVYFGLEQLEDTDESDLVEILGDDANDADKVYQFRERQSLEFDRLAYEAVTKLFKPFGHIENEGLDSNSSLLCRFTVRRDKLSDLLTLVQKHRGGGDDMIFVAGNSVASNFMVVDHPGLSLGIGLMEYVMGECTKCGDSTDVDEGWDGLCVNCRIYKLRAEAPSDIGRLLGVVPVTDMIYRREPGQTDVIVTITSPWPLAKIKAALGAIQDGHVMAETIQLTKKLHNGEQK
jgi:hypothetical protein